RRRRGAVVERRRDAAGRGRAGRQRRRVGARQRAPVLRSVLVAKAAARRRLLREGGADALQQGRLLRRGGGGAALGAERDQRSGRRADGHRLSLREAGIVRRLVFALLVCGCAPSSEILLHVDTDALVPPAIPDDTRPPWLFDRVRLEVLRGGQPIDPPAARDFALTEDLFRAGQVSIGIAATPGESDLSARVRLYRSGRIVAGEPRRSSTLDTTVTLPSVGTSDRVDVTVRLHTDDVGLPKGPIAPDAGLPGPSQVSTWPGAAIVPCHGQPGPDEVCVPGGAYWMGDPLLGNLGDGLDADQERLAVLSPFFLDAREVTVADYRAVAAALNEDKPPEHPDPGNSTSDLLTWC